MNDLALKDHPIGPSRITQPIPQEFSGVTEVAFITPSNSLRVFGVTGGAIIAEEDKTRWNMLLTDYAYYIPGTYLV